jgi:hypothetical protein
MFVALNCTGDYDSRKGIASRLFGTLVRTYGLLTNISCKQLLGRWLSHCPRRRLSKLSKLMGLLLMGPCAHARPWSRPALRQGALLAYRVLAAPAPLPEGLPPALLVPVGTLSGGGRSRRCYNSFCPSTYSLPRPRGCNSGSK